MGREADNRYDAIFVGGGVIGLACAWRASQRGARVCVLERDRPAAGATGVAAGMLAPVGEASWGEERLLVFNFESLGRWPGFAEQLESEAELEVGFSQSGALHVAVDRDEAEELRRRFELHRSLGLDSEWLSGRECRRLEAGSRHGRSRRRPRARRGQCRSEEGGRGPARGARSPKRRRPFRRGGDGRRASGWRLARGDGGWTGARRVEPRARRRLLVGPGALAARGRSSGPAREG